MPVLGIHSVSNAFSNYIPGIGTYIPFRMLLSRLTSSGPVFGAIGYRGAPNSSMNPWNSGQFFAEV
jgi:hypothetical protein